MFSVAEQKQIEAHIKNSNKLKLYGIVICIYTGLCLGELLALEWKNVDLDACQRTVKKLVTTSMDNALRTLLKP